MNARNLSCSILLLSLAGGCIPTLNPVYTEKDLVFDPAVLGTWVQPNNESTWDLTRLDDASYRLVIAEKQGASGRFVAHLANIEGGLFLDLFPEEVQGDASGFYKLHLLPIHTVYRVNSIGPKLELAAVDFKWLEKFLDEHPSAIEHVKVSGGNLITAPTDKVRQFVLEHREMFTESFSLERPGEAHQE